VPVAAAGKEGKMPDAMNDILMSLQAIFEKAGIRPGERVRSVPPAALASAADG
jgi:hypothetical protein